MRRPGGVYNFSRLGRSVCRGTRAICGAMADMNTRRLALARLSLTGGTLALLVGLTACGTRSGGGPLFGSGLPPALEAQRKQLQDSFAGTPVTVEAMDGARLRVQVPLKNSFDPGRFPVKPALAKVMEKLAPGMSANASAVLRVRQPADDKASASLMRERAASLRDMLIGLGVPAARLQVSSDAADGAATEFVVTDGSAVKPPAAK